MQADIKRVIAYSTMSQIGYMFVGAGVGAYSAAMFHLMTHAFFKALLFLAAGIIIHALSGEQDMRKMGGLGKALPYTRNVFLVGSLALVGIPPFAGFFSKDSIIAATLDQGRLRLLLFAACLVGAFLTGLYAFRLFFIVFGGERSTFAEEHLHHAEAATRARSRCSGRSASSPCSRPSAAASSSRRSGPRSRNWLDAGRAADRRRRAGRRSRRLGPRARARARRDLRRLRSSTPAKPLQVPKPLHAASRRSSTGTSSTTRSSTSRPT